MLRILATSSNHGKTRSAYSQEEVVYASARQAALIRSVEPETTSDRVPLEAPVVTLGLFEHLPERALPLARLLVLLLDPQSHLHHAPRDVPITPERLHCLVVIARPRCLVEQGPPRVLVLAD